MNASQALARWLAEQVEVWSLKFVAYKNRLGVPDVPTRPIVMSGYKAGSDLRRTYANLSAPDVIQTVDTRKVQANAQTRAREVIKAKAPPVVKA